MGAKGRCIKCKGNRFEPIEEIENHGVAGTTYCVVISGRKCTSCDEVYLEGPGVARAELQVAAEVARRGPANAETFRFMRRVLGLKSGELGDSVPNLHIEKPCDSQNLRRIVNERMR